MAQVDLVIWLPRAREDAAGQYQQRLWCTFEAAMVQLRGDVPVVAAGFLPSLGQRALVAAGSFSCMPLWLSPADCGESDLALLHAINFAYYLAALVLTASYVVFFQYVAVESQYSSRILLWITSQIILCALWLALRNMDEVSASVAKAKHGAMVLRYMYAAAARGLFLTPAPESISTMPNDDLCAALLQRLPWLDGYDRRDGMAIAALLSWFSKPESSQAARDSSQYALAFSLYWNAQLHHSKGDDPTGLSVRSWFKQAGIDLYADGRVHSLLAPQDEQPELLSQVVGEWSDHVMHIGDIHASPGGIRQPSRERRSSRSLSMQNIQIEVSTTTGACGGETSEKSVGGCEQERSSTAKQRRATPTMYSACGREVLRYTDLKHYGWQFHRGMCDTCVRCPRSTVKPFVAPRRHR
jgi:hypothetical protein